MKKLVAVALVLALQFVFGGFVWAQTTVFEDNFNSSPLDTTTKWRRGNNSSGITIPSGQAFLRVISPVDEFGWIVTKQSYSFLNTSVTLKIKKANIEGNIGVCPTPPSLTSSVGINSEPHYYRFYVGKSNGSNQPPYRLYAYKKKNGAQELPLKFIDLDSPYGDGTLPFYIRLVSRDNIIYFLYSYDGTCWSQFYSEVFDLPGYTSSSNFYYEIAANNTPANGNFEVDDFKIESYTSPTLTEKPVLDDPLNSSTFDSTTNANVKRSFDGPSSNFTGTSWKPRNSKANLVGDLVEYDLSRYITRGRLEIDVKQFEPAAQNDTDDRRQRHHVLAMFRQPWGGHHVVESTDTFWDLHTGKNYNGGIKFMTNTYYSCDEVQTVVPGGPNDKVKWVKSNIPYHFKVVWDDNSVDFYRNDTLIASNLIQNPMELRYLYVGRDRTVSGDTATQFQSNQYPTMSDADGPIYSNVLVKELVPSADVTAPIITLKGDIDGNGVYNQEKYSEEFANAARVFWNTNETNVVCHVKYGTTSGSLNLSTPVLETPSNSTGEFSALLENLSANTRYYFRVYGRDASGNIGSSIEGTFTTLEQGTRYLFTPVADAFVENDNDIAGYTHLYAPKRSTANMGWMNLMSAYGRNAYMEFNVTGVTGTIMRADLRLHCRQGGSGGGDLKRMALQTGISAWEDDITWANRGTYINATNPTPPTLGSINSVTAGQWHGISVTSAVPQNGQYVFALIGRTTDTAVIAFDSRESTNYKPELIIQAVPFTLVNLNGAISAVKNGASAWGDYDGDGDWDLLHTGELASGLPFTKLYKQNNGSFTAVSTSLTDVKNSAVAWGDYDMDNDLDVLLAGMNASGSRITKIFRNDGNDTFVDINAPLQGIDNGEVAWGNYTNDGYMDLVVSGDSANAGNNNVGAFTKVYRGKLSGGQRTWEAVSIGVIPKVNNSSVAWGENNVDGWLDLMVAGTDPSGAGVIKVFNNKITSSGSRSFYEVSGSGLTQAQTSSCVWRNFDKNGTLDVAHVGAVTANTSAFKRAPAGGYSLVSDDSLKNLRDGALAWGDYDNDGDLDLLLTGYDGSQRHTKLYRYDHFSEQFVFMENYTGVRYSALAWGDYDNDKDLDFLLSGEGASGPIVELYKNNVSSSNQAPPVPTQLDTSYTYADSGSYVVEYATLTWLKPQDNKRKTPQSALTFNVMVGTQADSFNLISPLSDPNSGKRLLPTGGNAERNNKYIFRTNNLPNGTYYWKVQALDNLFAASAFASGVFTIHRPSAPKLLAETEKTAAIPERFALSQNYPNPFNITTRLNLDLPEEGRVRATLYDIQGQEVVRLREGEMPAGYHVLDWEGRNAKATVVSSGVYVLKVVYEKSSGGREEATQRILLVK